MKQFIRFLLLTAIIVLLVIVLFISFWFVLLFAAAGFLLAIYRSFLERRKMRDIKTSRKSYTRGEVVDITAETVYDRIQINETDK